MPDILRFFVNELLGNISSAVQSKVNRKSNITSINNNMKSVLCCHGDGSVGPKYETLSFIKAIIFPVGLSSCIIITTLCGATLDLQCNTHTAAAAHS